MTIPLPHIAGLDWIPDGAQFTADPTREFWDHYFHAQRPELRSIGVTASKDAAGWHVYFNPAVIPAEQMTVIAIAMREKAHAAQMSASDPQAAHEKWRREQEAERQARYVANEEKRAADQAEAQALGRQCLATWGLFAHQKVKMREWVEAPRLIRWQIDALKSAVRETERKATRRSVEAADTKGGVEWPDDRVEAAIRYLTGHDEDHAAYRNDIGWSSADSSNGHWCNAMLSVDRPLAIAVGRVLVAKYQRQLKPLIDGFNRDAA